MNTPHSMNTRREFVAAAAAGLTLAGCSSGPSGPSPVAILKAASYSDDLAGILMRGAKLCGLDVRGKRVLLKPNLVEFDRATSINTNVAVLAAAVELFRKLGAAEVRIGEGPGHRRDTVHLAEEAGYRRLIAGFDGLFTDLNRDDVAPSGSLGFHDRMYLPRTALGADLIVSIAKMKTHHWAGATLAMKNLFGLVPGSVYGWPKNLLHYIGIPESITGLNRIFRRTFAIIDGVVGMEGNGPIQGEPKKAGVIVMGGDVVAVDATCCRIMGINPDGVRFLQLSSDLGILDPARIEQRGEAIASVRTPFRLIHEFRKLRLEGV